MRLPKSPRPDNLTQARLQEVLRFDADTGRLHWKNTGKGRPLDLTKEAGNRRPDGYRAIYIDSRLYLTHRLVWLYVHGEWPPHDIDHINHDKSDNRIENLRPATRTENKGNSLGKSGHLKGTTPFRNKWKAAIGFQRKTFHIGVFATEEEAHAAYMAKAQELYGDFAFMGRNATAR